MASEYASPVEDSRWRARTETSLADEGRRLEIPDFARIEKKEGEMTKC